MSRYVVSVHQDAELSDVGIITRGDLVRALSQMQISKSVKQVEDAALHKTLHDRIRAQPWVNESYIGITANDGVVELWGLSSWPPW